MVVLVGVVSLILRLYGELHPRSFFYYIENTRIIKIFLRRFLRHCSAKNIARIYFLSCLITSNLCIKSDNVYLFG